MHSRREIKLIERVPQPPSKVGSKRSPQKKKKEACLKKEETTVCPCSVATYVKKVKAISKDAFGKEFIAWNLL